MAERFDDALDTLASELRDAGVPRAGVDPAKLMPPCAYVAMTSLEAGTLAGDFDATVDVVLIAPDHGTKPALSHLADMLDSATDAVTFDGPIRAASIRLQSSGATALPALTLTTTIEVKGY